MFNDKQKQRLTGIAESAAKFFRTKTFRNTQMSDIARDLEMSVGTLYIYMKSKKALFDFTLMYVFDDDVFTRGIELPFTGIEHEMLFNEYINKLFQKSVTELEIRIQDKKKYNDFEDFMSEFFSVLSRYWKGMLIIERNGISWPYLLERYNKLRDNTFMIFKQYINKRTEQKFIRQLKNIDLAFYLFIESFALFAMHRHDRNIKNINDEQAKETVIDLMKHAFMNKEYV